MVHRDEDEVPERRSSLVPRWLAAAVLIVLGAAALLSAWLLVSADLQTAVPDHLRDEHP